MRDKRKVWGVYNADGDVISFEEKEEDASKLKNQDTPIGLHSKPHEVVEFEEVG